VGQDNQTCTNTYDDLARLSGNNCGNVWAQTFSYDAFGNVSKSGSISWQPNYTNAANQYLGGWNGVSYDKNGNLLNDTFNTYTWDIFGDLASANAATVTYDALGRMVELNGGPNAPTAQFVRSPSGGAVVETAGQNLLQSILPLPGGGYTLSYGPSNITYYAHPDWLGSIRLTG
jgi:hypothetical protein